MLPAEHLTTGFCACEIIGEKWIVSLCTPIHGLEAPSPQANVLRD